MPRMSEYPAAAALTANDRFLIVQQGQTRGLDSLYVPTIDALLSITSPIHDSTVTVLDEKRGGLFVYDATRSAENDGGIVLNGWVRQFRGPAWVRWFGTTTADIQRAIDCGVAHVRIDAGDYVVTKNTALPAERYPGGDFPSQPCLEIYDRHGFSLIGEPGARLIVETHAQGILEIQKSSNVLIEGIEFVGAGNFPPIDGTTGRSEKGVTGQGYQTIGFWNYRKNNSWNTSADDRGGFGGAFPQWGGGTAGTWGVWNGGYIGNLGSGILIHNDCHNITVRRNNIHGFNYNGVTVGFAGDYFPADLGFPDSTNIVVVQNYLHDNYNAGCSTYAVDGLLVTDNLIERMGHPSAAPLTQTIADPGYGFATLGLPWATTKAAVVSQNIVRDCVRKGLDTHGSIGMSFVSNTVTNCGACGIYSAWTAPDAPAIGTVIDGNTITNCGYATNTLGAICLEGLIDANYSYANIQLDAVVSDNLLADCYGPFGIIRARVGRNVTISGNIVRGVDSRRSTETYAFQVGRPNPDRSFNVQIKDNIIDANGNSFLTRGLQLQNLDDSAVSGNIVKLDHDTAGLVGINGAVGEVCSFIGNHVMLGPQGTPLAIAGTKGVCYGNTSRGGNQVSAVRSAQKQVFDAPWAIQLDVIMNDTTEPEFTVYAGQQYVDDVISDSFGLRVVLKDIQASGAHVRALWTELSAQGARTNANAPLFAYQREAGTAYVLIGLKADPAIDVHTPAENALGGFRIFIFVA